MKVEDSNLIDQIKDIHISDNGRYYFFEDFIIAEINKDIVYTWESAQDVIEAAYNFYGQNISVCYITNRVNQYSINPSDWLKFFKADHPLNGYAIVSESEIGWDSSIL